MRKIIPEKSIQRLLLYHRYLSFLVQQGAKNISSKSLADLMEIMDTQVRKDLSYFGKLGKRGAGYDVISLRNTIAGILGIKEKKRVCIVGMGNLGSALAAYKGFEALGFSVSAVFDNSLHKIGHRIKGHLCQDISKLARAVKANEIKIVLLTVPAESAQETALFLEKCGVKAILNFTPVKLSLSKHTKVRNIDLALELKTLSFFMK